MNDIFFNQHIIMYDNNLTLQNPINISDDVDGSASSYTITYYSLFSGSICGRATIPVPSDFCVNGICRHVFDSSSSVCNDVTQFYVTAYATNVFGDGTPSTPIYVNMSDIQSLHDHLLSQCNQSECLSMKECANIVL